MFFSTSKPPKGTGPLEGAGEGRFHLCGFRFQRSRYNAAFQSSIFEPPPEQLQSTFVPAGAQKQQKEKICWNVFFLPCDFDFVYKYICICATYRAILDSLMFSDLRDVWKGSPRLRISAQASGEIRPLRRSLETMMKRTGPRTTTKGQSFHAHNVPKFVFLVVYKRKFRGNPPNILFERKPTAKTIQKIHCASVVSSAWESMKFLKKNHVIWRTYAQCLRPLFPRRGYESMPFPKRKELKFFWDLVRSVVWFLCGSFGFPWQTPSLNHACRFTLQGCSCFFLHFFLSPRQFLLLGVEVGLFLEPGKENLMNSLGDRWILMVFPLTLRGPSTAHSVGGKASPGLKRVISRPRRITCQRGKGSTTSFAPLAKEHRMLIIRWRCFCVIGLKKEGASRT